MLRRAAHTGDISEDTASLAHGDQLDLRIDLVPYEAPVRRAHGFDLCPAGFTSRPMSRRRNGDIGKCRHREMSNAESPGITAHEHADGKSSKPRWSARPTTRPSTVRMSRVVESGGPKSKGPMTSRGEHAYLSGTESVIGDKEPSAAPVDRRWHRQLRNGTKP